MSCTKISVFFAIAKNACFSKRQDIVRGPTFALRPFKVSAVQDHFMDAQFIHNNLFKKIIQKSDGHILMPHFECLFEATN